MTVKRQSQKSKGIVKYQIKQLKRLLKQYQSVIYDIIFSVIHKWRLYEKLL